MAKHALMIGWNRAVTGREQDAAELFSMSMSYWNRLRDKGAIEDFEPVIVHGHGGDLNGFVMLRGDEDMLHKVTRSDEFKELTLKGNYMLMGFGVVHASVGEGAVEMMTRWNKLITD